MKGFFASALALLVITAGCGGSNPPIHIGSPVGPFLFMVGQASNSLFSFKGSNSGLLSPIASAATGQAPSAVALEIFDTDEQNLYVANAASNNLSVVSVSPNTGMVTSSGITITVGTNPIAVGLRGPSGMPTGGPVDRGDLYVLNQGSNSISAFRIADTAGHMNSIPGSPFATQANPQAMAVVTGGTSQTNIATFVYVANGTFGTISGFKANADGSLTEVAGSPFAVGANITALRSPAGGVFLLASDAANNAVLGFKITQETGAITPLPGSPFPAGTQPGAIIFPVGLSNLVYVANQGSNNISGYKFDFANNTLTALPGSPFPAGNNPVSLDIVLNTQLYVANRGSSDISGFNIDGTTGALTPMAGSPFHMPTAPNAIQGLFIMNVD
jgi:6-phosphogluconolactonase (cycloisomerase 2 family)